MGQGLEMTFCDDRAAMVMAVLVTERWKMDVDEEVRLWIDESQ
jgi:hypothetical protein